MSTISELCRSLEKRGGIAQSLIGDTSLQRMIRRAEEFQRLHDNAISNLNALGDLVRGIERGFGLAFHTTLDPHAIEVGLQRSRRFGEICIQLKWPPLGHVPARIISQITTAFEAGKLTPENVADIFVAYHTPERMREIRDRWACYDWLSHRLSILQEALDNHIEGRYPSAVCVMLTQIEGAQLDALGQKPTVVDSVGFIGGYQPEVATKFFADVVMENFKPDAVSPVPELSRHAILHGKATDYGTASHSLRVILIADIIFSGIDESRGQPAEGELDAKGEDNAAE